jgi:Fe-S oxidoreductase
MSVNPPLVLVEPSVAARRRVFARLRARNERPEFDIDSIKKRLAKMREESIRDSGWLMEDFTRAVKGKGIKILVAKDERAAALYIRKAARGYGHLLINKSATVREMAPALIKEGFYIVDTYDAEDRSGEAISDIWSRWQLGEPEPRTIWESFEPSTPTAFDGKALPLPKGRWAGVVGLSAASSRDGKMYFVQHTHNLAKILYSAKKLFVVGGIEKLAPKNDDAVFQARAAALFGLSAVLEDALHRTPAAEHNDSPQTTFWPGMPEEVHVILLDVGRRTILRSKNKKILECISCKACRRGCMMDRLGTCSPRDAAMLGIASSPAETEKRGLYECTMCEGCRTICPLEIPTNEYNLALRRRLAAKGGLPEVFRAQASSILDRGNPFGESATGRAQFHPVPRPKKGAPVLLYLGCVASFQRQKIVDGAFRLLEASGIDFSVLGEGEKCCGYPLYVSGSKKFEEAARRNLDAIRSSGARSVVTTCAGCNKTLSKIYPEHFDMDFEVMHIVEYLARQASRDMIRFGRSPFDDGKSGAPAAKAVIYHDPCDLGRAMGVFEPPRALLSAVPGIKPVEFHFNRQSSRCCGAGGGAKGYDNELSEQHAFDRMKEAVDMGAEVVCSACPACLANLQISIPRIKKETGKALRFMDLTEILARSL